MSGYSLWLSPISPSPLESYLNLLSNRLNTVKFNPHVTLISDKIVPTLPIKDILEIIKKGVEVWKSTNLKVEGLGDNNDLIKFKDVRQGDLFYQCVLIALHPTNSLISLHESLLKSFKFQPPKPITYFPHLSLIYGNLTYEMKDEIIKEMKLNKEVIEMLDENKVKVVGIDGFIPNEILLVKTKGNTSEWEILGRVSL